MPRPITATLHLAAFDNNLQVIRRQAPGAKVWSVVKANAYGHGLKHVWRSLANTDGFALLDLAEAVLLRESGWQGRFCCWRVFSSRRIWRWSIAIS
ncbi:Alanine racemase, catabolic [Serratia rubidaea]|uniref:Alanine racemase, catabolic n=1 Tax=Serratia rubidaea TaxID=61652 RepID=A0A4U9HHW2_SERRU|nr:Alanine racemase, catabolic [Serratia rubidaea]